MCRCIGFLFRLERDFRVLGYRYRIFRVFRERNLRVLVCMRLVDFFRGCMVWHRYIMVVGLIFMVSKIMCVVVYGFHVT